MLDETMVPPAHQMQHHVRALIYDVDLLGPIASTALWRICHAFDLYTATPEAISDRVRAVLLEPGASLALLAGADPERLADAELEGTLAASPETRAHLCGVICRGLAGRTPHSPGHGGRRVGAV